MKKVAFLCCLFYGLITQAIGARYNCKPQSLGPLAFKSSNEYLFLGDSNYNNKIALVCGHKGTDGCKHGAMVLVHGTFYYKDTSYEAKGVLKCDTSGGSSWDILGSDDFNKCSGQKKMFLGGIGEVDDGLGLYEVRAVTGGKYEDAYYIVFDELCVDEVKETDTTKASEKKPEQGAKQKQPAQNQSGNAEEKSKEKSAQDAKQNQSAQNQSGDAEENEEDKWLEPCSPEDLKKVPHAKEGRYIYRTKDEIVCAATKCEDGYYLVRNENRESQGWCNYGTDPYATTNASETTSAQGASSSDASGAGTSTQNQSGDARKNSEKESGQGAGQTQPGDAGEKSEKKPEQGAGQTQPGGGTAGQVQSTAAKVRALTQKIGSAASQLNSISSEFKVKVSVWKDAEGKFNTARLASDSIAGVVLGTAGGLITSHVVKKNQVENGFQDIKCTIGGQSVANWGDEFSVGIQ